MPVANEYLLLSGGAREGVLDLNPEDLGDYAKGADFDLDFTLLVPALKLHDRNQPVTLDMRHSPPCHSWLSLRLCDSKILSRWSVCCQEENGLSPEEEEEEGDTGRWTWAGVKWSQKSVEKGAKLAQFDSPAKLPLSPVFLTPPHGLSTNTETLMWTGRLPGLFPDMTAAKGEQPD